MASAKDACGDVPIVCNEDRFFAERVARAVGLEGPLGGTGEENPLAFLGFDRHVGRDGTRWLGVAALYPEWIDRVDFYERGRPVFTACAEPFYCYRTSTWTMNGVPNPDPAAWRAVVHHAGGRVSELTP